VNAQEPHDPIKHFCPGAGEEERAHRIALHRARDIAQARALRSKHWQARNLYWEAAELSAKWVFRPASIDDLQEIRRALGWMFLSAGVIQRLEAPDE
jgi:hypothetical protein